MTWTTDRMGDCRGQRVVITGANSGIGLEAARQLVGRGASVTLACRDVRRGDEAAASLEGRGDVTVRELDLANLASVREFATAFAGDEAMPITGLVANAGVMACPFELSQDGYELQMATNHLGHALLIALLWPVLAPKARVVLISSLAARGGTLSATTTRADLVSPHPYSRQTVYSNTKQANLLFAQELNRRARSASTDVVVVAAHPGVSMTELFPRQLRDTGLGWLVPIARPVLTVVLQSARAGALPTLRALEDPEIRGGELVGPSHLREIRGAPKILDLYPQGADEAAAVRLWELTEEILGTPLPG